MAGTPQTETPAEEVQAAIRRVAGKAAEWAALPPADKSALLKACLRRACDHRDELLRAACAARGVDMADPQQRHLVADARLLTVLVTSWLQGGAALLDSLAATGRPRPGDGVVPRPDGSTRVRFAPKATDKEWWMGQCVSELVVRGEPCQSNPSEEPPSVTGVLGAGNTEILNDIIDPLCRQNSVVVYKSNPVMELSNRVKEKLLQPLIERGYLAFVYGGVEPGKTLVESDLVDRIVMTGSHETFDKIVWGGRDKRDESAEPAVQKPVQAELGSVNPYIVVPGDASWSEADLEAQAEALVAYKLVNNGHVCAAPQVVVTCRQWPQRRAFLDAVRRKIASAPAPRVFYPGTAARLDGHRAAIGADGGEKAAILFREDLQVPEQRSDADPRPPVLGLRDEAFGPVLYEVALDTPASLTGFLPAAVEFCHARCWGNLTCMIVVDDATREAHLHDFDVALDSMRFGMVGVNCPASIANSSPTMVWGGFPGNGARDIQSGMGFLGNFGCYTAVEKGIMYARFRNLLSFRLAQTAEEAEVALRRAEKVARAYEKNTYLQIWKLLPGELKLAKRHHIKRTIAGRVHDACLRRPAL